MRKVYIIALAIISLMASSVSCTTDYDETEVRDILARLEDKVKDLEDACKRLNDNVIALNELLDVASRGDYITGISEITDESGALIGYRISFKIHDDLTVYNGHKGPKGDNGTDHSDYMPAIGVAAVDGVYYWTLDGKFILDANGNRIRAIGADGHDGKDSVVPQIRIKDGYWEVSTDESHSTWTRLGRADGYDYSDHTIFKSVTDRGSVIEFTLANGTSFTIRKNGQDVPNSVVVIPDYSDGSVAIPFTDRLGIISPQETTINFLVSPSELAETIARNGVNHVELRARYTDSTLEDKEGTIHVASLKMTSEGILCVGVDGTLESSFYKGTSSVFACLSITVGESSVNSRYFLLSPKDLTPPYLDLSSRGTSNCYIVSSPGYYQFCANTRGNSDISVGDPISASVEWESYGTSVAPVVGSLVQDVSLYEGHVFFKTPDSIQNGNAVIAVRNSSGTILWSWHIWICSGYDPDATSHTYPNNAVMMDRNLGATSSTTNAAASLGLLYQWGRKDPFVNSYSLYGTYKAGATKDWTSVANSTETGTLSYSIKNPTVFIKGGSNNHWLTDADMTCWRSAKTQYDPCPTGWRVPDGGDDNPWATFSTAKYSSSYYGYYLNGSYWYPFVGYLSSTYGTLSYTGTMARYWSATPYALNNKQVAGMSFDKGSFHPVESSLPGEGRAVRCMKEGSGPSTLTVSPTAINLDCVSGSAKTVRIETDARWTVGSLPSWLKVSQSSGVGNATITFTATSDNPNTVDRTSQVAISVPGRTTNVSVSQKYADVISTNKSSFTLDYRSGSYVDMSVYCNSDWKITSYPSSVSLSALSGQGNATVRITVKSDNTYSYIKSLGSIVISTEHKSATVELLQKACGYIAASPASMVFPYTIGSSRDISIQSNTDWTIKGLPSWLTASPMSGTGYTQVRFTTTSANPGAATRTGTVTISIGTDSISIPATQEGRPVMSGANCFIVSEYGEHSFDATKKGNSSEPVGDFSYVTVLWESFGTDVRPNVGDVVKNVSSSNGIITFTASGNDGNAVIAVKDAAGIILWSWHIWVCKGFDPQSTAQVYYNNAGTVMDRNLGATSAAKGDVKSLGLLYQWGRKDPFLGASSMQRYVGQASSTITWPSAVAANSSVGTLKYAIQHPTTFITSNNDWLISASEFEKTTRWTSSKSMYDPCPKGWVVPKGGINGLWAKALGSSATISKGPWDSNNKGMDFSGWVSSSSTVWYPATGFIYFEDGRFTGEHSSGYYWSCANYSVTSGEVLYFYSGGVVEPASRYYNANGQSVRCVKE